MANVILKKGTLEIMRINKDFVMEVKHMGDGLAIVMKDGMVLTHQDSYMPSQMKDIIIHMCMSTKNDVNVTIDLANYGQPVSISTK